MNTQTKIDVHAGIDTMATFIQANTEFLGVTIQNKQQLIEWYKRERDDQVQRTQNHARAIELMFNSLISTAEAELNEAKAHAEFLGLRVIPESEQPPTVSTGETAI